MASRLSSSLFWSPCLAIRGAIFLSGAGGISLRSVEKLQLNRMASTQTRMSRKFEKPDSSLQETKKLIWEGYKRNHKGSIPPKRVRLRCTRNLRRNIVGNPCPICLNEIEISYTDVDLLSQFICPHTGKVLKSGKTGVCQLQQKKLIDAIEKAADHGLLPYMIPEQPKETSPISHPPWNRIHLED